MRGEDEPVLDRERADLDTPVIRAPDAITDQAGDEVNCEYLVRVEWLKNVSEEEGVWAPGLFYRRNLTVDRLTSNATLEYLRDQFGIEDLGQRGARAEGDRP